MFEWVSSIPKMAMVLLGITFLPHCDSDCRSYHKTLSFEPLDPLTPSGQREAWTVAGMISRDAIESLSELVSHHIAFSQYVRCIRGNG